MDQKPLESRLHKCYRLSSLPTIFPLFQKIYFTEVQLIYNVLISTAQKVTQLYIYTIHIIFHYGLLQHIENSSLCYTVGLCVYPFSA